MNITVNKSILDNLCSDKVFKSELSEFFNSVIDEEIAKADKMDTELIDACIELLAKLEEESSGEAVIIPLISNEKIIKACTHRGFGNISRGVRASLIACIVLLSAMTANTVIAKVFDVNIAQEVASTISQKLQDWGILAENEDDKDIPVSKIPETTKASTEKATAAQKAEEKESTTKHNEMHKAEAAKAESTKAERESTTKAVPKPDVKPQAVDIKADSKPVALRLEFSKDFKTEYLWGESLNTKGLTVTAVYDGAATKRVHTSDCRFSGYNKALEGTQKIVVEYEGASATFEITLKKTSDKTEKVVTGVKGTAPTKLVYTTNDTAINLKGLRVRAVYSDGTYSSEYDYKSAVLLTKVDFSVTGEQLVTVRIANLFDYSFTIIIENVKTDFNIKSMRFEYSTYHFYLGEEPDYSKLYFHIVYNDGKSVYKNYNDVKDEISIIGVDTSEQTIGYTKSFTAYYKGCTAASRYTVESRNSVLKVEYDKSMGYGNTNYKHKFLYYYGEDLCLGKEHSDFFSDITHLKSTNSFIDGEEKNSYDFLLTGCLWRFKVYWSGVGGQFCKYYYPNELDFYGYDPYTIGYQSVDVFYEGVYLTNIIVFVYGDEGYVPTKIPNTTVTFGNEAQDLKTGSWMRCIGDGNLTLDDRYKPIIDEYLKEYGNIDDAYKAAYNDPMVKFISGSASDAVLEDENTPGWQKAVVNLPSGESYSYRVCHAYQISKCEASQKNPFLKLNINDFADRNFGDLSFNIESSDGSLLNVPASQTSVYYFQSYNEGSLTYSEISPDTKFDSMFVWAKFLFDRSKYYYSDATAAVYPTKVVYAYSNGFEDAVTAELLSDAADQDTFAKGIDKAYFLDHKYTLRLHAFDNYFDVFYDCVKLSGIDLNKSGEYDAVFSVDLGSETISINRKIYIVDKIADSGLKIISDPNKGSDTLMPGDTFNIEGIKLEYTDRRGRVMQLTENDVTYEIIQGGSGHLIDSEMNTKAIKVSYSYMNEWGKKATISESYFPWGNVISVDYRFSKTANAVVVNWREVKDADYYIVTYLGETYISRDTSVSCDKNLKNGTIYHEPVKVVPVKNVGDRKLIGFGKEYCIINFTINGYIPSDEQINK